MLSLHDGTNCPWDATSTQINLESTQEDKWADVASPYSHISLFNLSWYQSTHSGSLPDKRLLFAPSGLPPQNTFYWSWLQREGEQVHSCILAHVVHFIPVLTSSLPPSLPLSFSFPSPWKWSLPPALYANAKRDLAWFSSALPTYRGTGLAAASSPSQPASPLFKLWHNLKEPQPKICDEDDEQLSFAVNSHPLLFLPLPARNVPRAGRWQRHTKQRSAIKVTTWSDVTAARAARSKAASAPFGIRTRLDRGP